MLVAAVIAGLTGNLLASCSKPAAEETAEAAVFTPVPDLSAPIEFSESVVMEDTPGTKGLDPVDGALEGIKHQRFGVFSWWNPRADAFDALTNPANIYQSNSDVVFVEDLSSDLRKWRCTPRAYWPFSCNLSFFAYAPYLEHTQPWEEGGETRQPELMFPSADYTQGMPRATYSPDTNVTHQVDFCIAAPVFDREPSPTPIHFAFKHSTTRIRLFVKADGDRPPGYDYRIDDAIISGVVGTNTFTYNDDPDRPFIWDAVTASTPKSGEYHLSVNDAELSESMVNMISEHPGSDISTYTAINSRPNGRLYLLPQELTSDASLELAIGMYNISSGAPIRNSILPPFKVNLPVSQAWNPAQTIAYLITVDVSRYVVLDIVPLVIPWVDAGNTHPDQIIY